MVASVVGHTACILLGMKPVLSHLPPAPAPCAFCGSTLSSDRTLFHSLPRRSSSASVSIDRIQPLQSAFLRTGRSPLHRDVASRGRSGCLVVEAGPWERDDGYYDQDMYDMDSYGAYAPPKRRVRRSRRAPWEDIQWSNVPRKQRVTGNAGDDGSNEGIRDGGRSADAFDSRRGNDAPNEDDGEYLEPSGRRQQRSRPRTRRLPSSSLPW